VFHFMACMRFLLLFERAPIPGNHGACAARRLIVAGGSSAAANRTA
jgi:hypothetical protein